MEQLNRIELKGNVGSAVKTNNIGSETIVRFDLATNRFFTTKDGEPGFETTWHHIIAFLGDGISDCTLAQIRRGSFAHIVGGGLDKREGKVCFRKGLQTNGNVLIL